MELIANHSSMMESPTAILKQIGKTAGLVLVVSLALYGVIALVTELRSGRWIVALALSAPLTALLGFVVLDALQARAIPVWRHAVTRKREPGAYWLNIACFAVCFVMIGAMAVWSGTELLVELTAPPCDSPCAEGP